MVRIYVSEITGAQLLGSTDPRYVKNWCSEHGVDIYSESNKSYVNHAEFELAYNRQFTSDLKNRFPEDWEQRYDHYNRGDVLSLMKLKEKYYKVPMTVLRGGRYQHPEDSGNTCSLRVRKYNPKSKSGIDRAKKYRSE